MAAASHRIALTGAVRAAADLFRPDHTHPHETALPRMRGKVWAVLKGQFG